MTNIRDTSFMYTSVLYQEYIKNSYSFTGDMRVCVVEEPKWRMVQNKWRINADMYRHMAYLTSYTLESSKGSQD